MGVKIVDTTLRDAHQSLFATRMTTEEILSVASKLDKAGFYAMEVWGGATFDACLRFLNEDPWERLRLIRKACPNTKLQMLCRGQNLLGYRHYSDDVVDLFCKKTIENGIDIIRVFDALNDLRNLKQAVVSTKKYGGHCQIALSYTTSPVHTVEYYVNLAKEIEHDLGADSICIKDMAGVLTPQDAKKLITALKKNTKLPIELHSHCTGGICEMTYMAAIEAGVDILDCAVSPLSNGTAQPSIQALSTCLKGTKYDPKIDHSVLYECEPLLEAIKQKNLKNGKLTVKSLSVNPNILKYQVPGGMLSNLTSQLSEQNAMDRYDEVLKEIPEVRKDLGYPPLVTPLSQMVGTQSVLNVLSGKRYKLVAKEIKDYLHGKYGKWPSGVDKDLLKSIVGDEQIITCRPADLLKPELDELRKKYKDIARSDEDIISLALFEKVAVEFLNNKYNKKEDSLNKDEVVEFNLYV